jgi:RNA polymerase sigma-70 factor (ECF subfamily)
LDIVALEESEDIQVIERLRQGDVAAMTLIMQQNNHALWRIARGILRHESEADDVVQDAYVNAFTHLADFRGESSLYTWLARITMNEALRRLRRRRPTTDLHEVAETVAVDHPHATTPPAGADPEHSAARREIRRIVERAIDALPPPFRIVFVMRAMEQMSIEDTALQLGISPATVKTRLHRAKQQLRKALGVQFADVFDGIFPFAGVRCEQLQQAVLTRLRAVARCPSVAGASAASGRRARSRRHCRRSAGY